MPPVRSSSQRNTLRSSADFFVSVLRLFFRERKRKGCPADPLPAVVRVLAEDAGAEELVPLSLDLVPEGFVDSALAFVFAFAFLDLTFPGALFPAFSVPSKLYLDMREAKSSELDMRLGCTFRCG
jgi:hypothetical protein